jgi:hypothetical protein
MDDEELKTLFTLKYGRPELYSSEWTAEELPDELLNILVGKRDIDQPRNVKSLILLIRFNRVKKTIRFDEFVFERYVEYMKRKHE